MSKVKTAIIAIASSLLLTACQHTQPNESERARLIAETLSLAISVRLVESCPNHFSLTDNQLLLQRAQRLRANIGEEKFMEAVSKIEKPQSCAKAHEDAAKIARSLPFAILLDPT